MSSEFDVLALHAQECNDQRAKEKEISAGRVLAWTSG